MANIKTICKTTKDAIQQGNVLELQRIVHQGEDIDGFDSKFKFTPLHWAAHFGSLECMHWLLWHGANINSTSKDAWSPAHIAAIRGRSSCMQALAANGADLSLLDSKEKSPAHLASSHGNAQTLQEILRKGVDTETRDNMGWTPAHTAAFHGRTACLQLLIKWGCDVSSLDPNGNTLAHLAASEGHVLCLKLVMATSKNIASFVKSRNDMGEKPIDCAVQCYKKECVDSLKVVEYDAENPEIAEDLSYPAHHSAYRGDLAYLQMVLETGVASINDRDERNSTPLHKAAGCGQIEVVKWLIKKGADTSLLNRAGETARDVALRFGKLACGKLLGGDVIEYEDEGCGEMTEKKKEFIDNDAKVRAERKLKELFNQLEIAKLNYRQLGGVLDDDLEKIQQDKQNAKIVRDFEDQLEYERVKREKLEQQLDEMRLHVHKLHRQLQDEREKVDELMISSKVNQNDELRQNNNNTKKMTRSHQSKQPSPGIFLVQKTAKNKTSQSNDKKPNQIIPRPPKSDKSKTSTNSSTRLRRKNSTESDVTLSKYLNNSRNGRLSSSRNGSVKSRSTKRRSSDSDQSDHSSHGNKVSPRSTLSMSSRNRKNFQNGSVASDERPARKEGKSPARKHSQDEGAASEKEEKSIFGKLTSAFRRKDSSSSSSSSD